MRQHAKGAIEMLKFALGAFGALFAVAAWCGIAVFLAFEGWWMQPIAPRNDHNAFFLEAGKAIDKSNPGNTSFILIEGGDVVGEYFAKTERSINANTVFPTSSFSKWITALGVMALVEDGRVNLDEPVSTYLTRWRLPEGAYDIDGVTVRRLLSHTSGLTDGLGFGDYRVDETVPTIEQTLASPRASSDRPVAIAVGAEPGAEFNYSGGGYLILQLLIEEVSGREYQQYIQDTILTPLQMDRSSFEFIGNIEGATQSYTLAGEIAPQYNYAAAGATGFSTSANDLVRLVSAVANGNAALGISADAMKSMREPEAYVFGSPIWGLGEILYAQTRNGDFIFGHDGANEPAINASVRINPDSGDAFIMLVNGHPSLASDIGGEWVLWQTGKPDILTTERALKSAVPPAIIGGFLIIALIVAAARRSRSISPARP